MPCQLTFCGQVALEPHEFGALILFEVFNVMACFIKFLIFSGKRKVDNNTNMLSLYRVNPAATWVIEPHKPL